MHINRSAIFAASSVILVFGASLYFADYYRVRRSEAIKIFLNLGATRVQRLVNQTHEVLSGLSRSRAIRSGDSVACAELFGSYLARYEEYSGFLLAGATGDVICSSPPAPRPINVSDRIHFKKVITEGRFASGDWQIGRLTREVIIPFGYPVLDVSGQITGMVAAGLDLSRLSEWSEKLGLPADSRFLLLDPNGTVLAHNPKKFQVGENIKETEIFEHIQDARRDGKSESVFDAHGLDGVLRTYAFRAVSNPVGFGDFLELYVVIGIR